MMRLNPEGYLRLVQSSAFEASYAGGEANVAVSLANYGMDAAYVTKVPAHEIGQCAVNELSGLAGLQTDLRQMSSQSRSDPRPVEPVRALKNGGPVKVGGRGRLHRQRGGCQGRFRHRGGGHRHRRRQAQSGGFMWRVSTP